MSSREDQVLERQRQMANRLSQMSAAAASCRNHHQGGERAKGINNAKKTPPPPPGAGALSKMQNAKAKGGGSKRSLASLTGVTPKSATSPPATGGRGRGTSEDPIVLDGEGGGSGQKRQRQQRPSQHKGSSGGDGCDNGQKRSTADTALQQKRPPLKRPPLKRPTPPLKRPTPRGGKTPEEAASETRANTAEMALARARQRAGVKQPKSTNQLKRPAMRRGTISQAIAASASQAASANSTGGAGSKSLSSLLMSNTDTAKYLGPNAPKILKHYRKIEPNDYWKSIRGWDFLSELNDKMASQKRGGNGGGGNGKRKRGDEKDSKRDDGTAKAKQQQKRQHAPLPDTFSSYREYCALWSPLCLDEARAQLLSDAISEIPYWKSKAEKNPVRVRLHPLKKDVGGTSEDMGVQVRDVLTSDYKDRMFVANDVVLLAKKESYVWEASKGTLEDPSSCRRGLVGHVEYTRRSMEGITIRVSRELWTELGTTELVLVKVGSNVTSLREYTALCRMDSIPLLDHILGTKTSTKKSKAADDDDGDGGEDVDPSAKERRAKKAVLSMMGGSSALGKGFATYASQKFNLSQLGAISSSAQEYGEGGFTLIKGPPGTGKTTTLCALLNALHIRQMNQYFGEVKKLAESYDAVVGKRASLSLSGAARKRPRILVCAPSNAAVDNVILKIMEDGFVDGNGCRYNPSIARIGRGQSASVKDVCLEEKVESYISDATEVTKLDNTIEGFKAECRRIHADIAKLRQRMNAIKNAAPYPLAKDWEIRINEDTARVYFVNHKEKTTTYEVPPPPEPGQRHFPAEAMPEYKAFVSQVVKMVERYNGISTRLERYSLCRDVSNAVRGGTNCHAMNAIRQQVETHILDSIHIVTTTLGTAGNRSLEAANKFEVVVIDEAAQSVEPSTLAGLQLGSSHAILVGDPQQLPATIFNVSGRNTKYDRSLFQRLEESGHDVHLLNTQYRMNPAISDFPRRIFYDGKLMDGPNVKHPEYGNPLKRAVFRKFQAFQPFTVLDLESTEERGGTSLSNTGEAQLALHLFNNLRVGTEGKSTSTRVAVITPYAQQAALLRRTFSNHLGSGYERFVEVSSVDAFQGREANIVIFSCVRAAGSKGIGFLSDVRRMNVALTRAKHFLFVIARCSSIVVNPYWRDLVDHARETEAVVRVPFSGSRQSLSFPDLRTLKALPPLQKQQAMESAMEALVNHRKKKQSANRNNDANEKLSSGRGYRTH